MTKIFTLLLMSLMLITGFSQDIETGLVARYSFCGNLSDDSGHDNNGAYMGASSPTYVTDSYGKENSALLFNGINDWVKVPPSTSMNSPVEEATVSCWVNYQSLAYGQWVPIFAKTDKIEVLSREYSLGINATTGQIYWHSTYVAQSDALQLNTWFHIAVTYTPEMLKCYLNGEFIGEAVPVDPLTGNDQPLEIGRDTPVSTDYFHGSMDEVNVYNRALTGADILALKNYDGCSSSSFNYLPELENVVIFPNPVNEKLAISYYDQHKYTIYLTDLLGNKVMTRTEQTATTMLDVSELTSGIYILHLVSKVGHFTEKVIKN